MVAPHRTTHTATGGANGSGAKAPANAGAQPAALPAQNPSIEQMKTADWQEEFHQRRRLEAARIPPRFSAKGLENFETGRNKMRKDLVHAATMYISGFTLKGTNFPKGLLMSGPVGCGKSHLAVAMLKEIIAKGYSGLYYNSPDLLRDIRATFDNKNELTEDDLLEEVTSTDLLVFDDIGAERSSEFVLDRFYLIINERYEGCKPVIVTTNLNEIEMEDRLGKRIVSRLYEMCESFAKFPDEDWRRKGMR
jgi:DNA replication protein DnaC